MITGIGTQTKNVVHDDNPQEGFNLLKSAGFNCCDFSLNSYLTNKDIYSQNINRFFDKSTDEHIAFFTPHKEAAKKAGIKINQMHMPYPIYVPNADDSVNDYLWNKVAPKSMEICKFLECPYIVIHGFKLSRVLGSEEAEWEKTAEFIDSIAGFAKENDITICIENLYNSYGGSLIEGPCCNAKKAVERINVFNEKYEAEVLGFCFDVGHANIVGLDFEDFITTLGSHLKVLHIHDNDGLQDLHQLPFTFTKTRENTPSTDWPGFIKGLKKIDYNGVLSFETAPVLTSFPDEMAEDVLRMICKIGEHMKISF